MDNSILFNSLNKKIQNIVNDEIVIILQKISKKYNIPIEELQNVIKIENNINKCLAKKQDGYQCTRNRKPNCDFCGKHILNRKYGRIDDNVNNENNNFEKMHIENINDINYLVDENNYVYNNNIDNPELIGIKENNSIKILNND